MSDRFFQFEGYKQIVSHLVGERGIRGDWRRLADALRIHPSQVSQVFRGHRNLTLEQAAIAADYLGLSALRTEYFVTMVAFDCTTSSRLRSILKASLERMKETATADQQSAQGQPKSVIPSMPKSSS